MGDCYTYDSASSPERMEKNDGKFDLNKCHPAYVARCKKISFIGNEIDYSIWCKGNIVDQRNDYTFKNDLAQDSSTIKDKSLYHPLDTQIGGDFPWKGISTGDPVQLKDPLKGQVEGNYYTNKAIQPIEYIQANNLSFEEGSIVKYITRWKEKGGIKDLEKIKHYVDLMIAFHNKDINSTNQTKD